MKNHRKPRKFRLLMTFIFLTALPLTTPTQSRGSDSYTEVLRHVQNRMGCDIQTAKAVILIINNFSENLQGHISDIASTNYAFDKRTLSNRIIKDYFTGPLAKVQVSHLNSPHVNEYTISVYLSRLANLSHRKGYSKVELVFLPDYLGIGTLEKITPRHFELSVSMWQVFRGYFGDGVGYEDWTRKKFRLNIYIHDDHISVKTGQILVAETLDEDSFHRKFYKEK